MELYSFIYWGTSLTNRVVLFPMLLYSMLPLWRMFSISCKFHKEQFLFTWYISDIIEFGTHWSPCEYPENMSEDWLTSDMSIVLWNNLSVASCKVVLVVWYIVVLLSLIPLSSSDVTSTFVLLNMISIIILYKFIYLLFFM